MINVTKTYLPDINTYKSYIDDIYSNEKITNNGPLVQKLEKALEDFLGVKKVLLVSNGTLALQLAYKILNLTGEVITTPFSFISTASSIQWEGLTPVFADINKKTLNIEPKRIKEKISVNTSAIVPVHVFSNSCEIEEIDKIAKENNLKIIYDAAHAFNVKYKDASILLNGDISTISFHATKLFHTIEGGALIINDSSLIEKATRVRNFGIESFESISHLGINAKMNEFQAAMGLSILKEFENITKRRKSIYERYQHELYSYVELQKQNPNSNNNYSYFPIAFKSEKELLKIQKKLNNENIFPRRYFYPSLNTLSFLPNEEMPHAEDISKRIMCIPMYDSLSFEDQSKIIKIIQAK